MTWGIKDKMEKEKVYFVSYSHSKGNGCCEIYMEKKIESYNDIKEIIERIEESKEDVCDVIVMYFKELKKRTKESSQQIKCQTKNV